MMVETYLIFNKCGQQWVRNRIIDLVLIPHFFRTIADLHSFYQICVLLLSIAVYAVRP